MQFTFLGGLENTFSILGDSTGPITGFVDLRTMLGGPSTTLLGDWSYSSPKVESHVRIDQYATFELL